MSTDKKYLVIGANGFIGRAMCNFLQQANISVKLLVRHKLKNNTNKQFIFKSIKDIKPNIFHGIDVVIYLIGKAHDLKLSSDISEYQKINVDLTLDIAKISANCNVSKFIFISSVKAGTSFHDKKDSVRNNIGKTGSVYGESKREAELGLLDIGRKSHMKVTILRPALVYGPGQKGNLALMLKGVKKGWFPPLPKTNNKRSMVHIDNLVNAIFFVSESNCVDGEVFIVADNRPYSSYEIYNVMRHITGKKVLKWGMPKFLFDMAALISPGIRHKLNKLLASEYYPSNKLDSLGFKYKKTLKDMNETSF